MWTMSWRVTENNNTGLIITRTGGFVMDIDDGCVVDRFGQHLLPESLPTKHLKIPQKVYQCVAS